MCALVCVRGMGLLLHTHAHTFVLFGMGYGVYYTTQAQLLCDTADVHPRKDAVMFALLALALFFLVKFMIWAVVAAVWICGAVLYVMLVLPFKIIAGILRRA